MRVSIAKLAEELGEALFGMGHGCRRVELPLGDGDQFLHIATTTDEITLETDAGNVVLLTLINVDGDIESFLVRCHSHLGGIDLEAQIATVHVVGA